MVNDKRRKRILGKLVRCASGEPSRRGRKGKDWRAPRKSPDRGKPEPVSQGLGRKRKGRGSQLGRLAWQYYLANACKGGNMQRRALGCQRALAPMQDRPGLAAPVSVQAWLRPAGSWCSQADAKTATGTNRGAALLLLVHF